MKTKNSVITSLALVFFLTMGSASLFASDHDHNNGFNKFSFGLHGGALISFTDIKETSFIPDSDEYAFGGGLFLNYHVSPILTFQGDFLYGELKGMDTDEDRMFEADIMQAMFTANVSLNGLLAPQGRTRDWMNLYAFTGAGVAFHSSKQTDLQGGLIRYPYDSNEADELHSAFVIPFGLGVNFRLSRRIDLGVKSSFYYAMTDELDAYVVPDSRKDMFNYTSVGLTIKLGRKERSKDWAPIQSTVYPGDVYRMDEMAFRITELEAQLEAVEASQAAGMEDVKKEIETVATGQQELSRTNVQLYGALEDLAQRLLQQETLLQEQIEKQQEERFYSVQVMAQRERIDIDEAKALLGIGFDLEVMYVDGWYKYYTGRYKDLENARLHLQRVWGQGVRDAFIVIYKNGALTPR